MKPPPPMLGPPLQGAFEEILAYDVDITIEEIGSILVREKIEYDFGSTPRHGILRDITDRLDYDDEHDRVYPITVVSVAAREGTPAQYTVESMERSTRVKIGDPDRTITGRHVYVITYRVQGALNGFDDHDELYWNVTGNEWPVPIGRVTAVVNAPASVTAAACFRGSFGSSLPCERANVDGSSAGFVDSSLGSNEGLTVVVAIPKGAVPEPEPVLAEIWNFGTAFSTDARPLGLAAGVLAACLFGVVWVLWRIGRDRKFAGSAIDAAFGSATGTEERVGIGERPTIPVEFVPPDGIRPGQVGTLIDEVANPLDVTATIVDLAVRGYLTIEEVERPGFFRKGDWSLKKSKDADDSLLEFERKLFHGLFKGRTDGVVLLSELREKFVKRMADVRDALYDDVVSNGWFPRRPDRVRAIWIGVAVVILVFAAGAAFALAALTNLGLVGVALVLGALLFLVVARKMPRRTPKGTATLRRVLGFREFITTSEKDRADFAERQNLFSEYLAYAIVFDCVDKWAKAFAGLGDQPPEVDWYRGSGPFTVHAFSESMRDFSVTTSGTLTSTPAGSGSSGFSGGGSSGGGGGGGGGGSW
ncbi:MAG: DUF2207 domain-containing protein [Acidimicrobiia bacterium]|nr:DUF2207 domain-containing protein [Acidimicrobiia bacterium]